MPMYYGVHKLKQLQKKSRFLSLCGQSSSATGAQRACALSTLGDFSTPNWVEVLSKRFLLLYLNPPVSSLNCLCMCWADGEVQAVSHPEAGTAGGFLQRLPTWVTQHSSFAPPQNEWFCLSVPQLAAFAHGDSERHHPALRALHQAE